MARATLRGLLDGLHPGAELTGGEAAKSELSPFRAEILDGRVGYVRLGSIGEEAACQRLTETSTLGAGVDMQFRQLEIIAHQTGAFIAWESDSVQSPHDLLLPPLIRRALIAVGDSQHGRGSQLLSGGNFPCPGFGLDGRHCSPAPPAGVVNPHRRTL